MQIPVIRQSVVQGYRGQLADGAVAGVRLCEVALDWRIQITRVVAESAVHVGDLARVLEL
ncbi:hypothetical protein D3C76_1826480 [compost metagenome]